MTAPLSRSPPYSLPLRSRLTLIALLALLALLVALLRAADALTKPPDTKACVAKVAEVDREAMRAVYAALPENLFFWPDDLGFSNWPIRMLDDNDNVTYCCVTPRPDAASCYLSCPIKCTPAGRITSIVSSPSREDMPGPAGTQGGSCPPGALSPAIGDLAELSSLVLRHSCLAGGLPDSVTRLQKLTELDMSDNSFSGPVPPGLFRLPRLSLVDLSTTIGGGLSGSLPDGPGAYSPSLETVRLSGNLLSGELPRALFRSRWLQEVRLESNNFTGELPGEAGAYARNIFALSLRSNGLTGGIPPVLAEMTALRELDLGDNGLSGSIPTAIATLSPLTRLALDQNRLTGDIVAALVPEAAAATGAPDQAPGAPDAVGAAAASAAGLRAAFQMLEVLDVSSNQLSGDAAALAPLPRGLGNLNASRNNLTCSAGSDLFAGAPSTDLSHNRISGALANVVRVSGLQRLRVAHNELSGSIPADLLSAVGDELDLSHNLLSGTIPHLCGPRTRIDLSYNNLTGELPRDAAAYKSSLESLSLRANGLTGAIPPALAGTMRGLTYLDLGENRLSGAPTTLAPLRGLDVVRLDGNALSGPFCDALLPARELWLGFNAFGGSGGGGGGSGGEGEGGQGEGDLHGCVVPARLEVLSAPHAGLRGSVPDDLFLRMDEQMGRIALGSQTQRLHVNLSRNSLTGTLKAFSVIRNGSLDVSHNNFTGSIPEALFRLASGGELERGASGASGSVEESRWGLERERVVVDVQSNELSGPLFDARRPAGEWPSYWNKLRASAAETEALLAVRDALLRGAAGRAAGGAGGAAEAVALVNGGNSSWAAILSSWDASSSSSSGSACEWYGVGCTADGHVHTLHLLGDATVALHPNVLPDMPDCEKGLYGEFSCTFEPLPPPRTTSFFLQGLRGGSGSGSESASASGSLSEALGQLTHLTSLRISGHVLSGGLPLSLSRLSHLVALDLSSNRHLSGSIPPALFALPSLRELTLRGNNLTGAPLPTTTAAPAATLPVPGLESLDVGGNALSGSIPAQVSLLTGLTRLALDHNQLDGSLPRELGALWMLRDLHLQGNAFRGGLDDITTAIDPPANASFGIDRYRSLIKLFPLLAVLDGRRRFLHAPPPYFPLLRYLNASHNNLTCESRQNFQQIASVVDLSHNQISGELVNIVEVAWTEHALMDVLRLSHNQLSGDVPSYLLGALGGELDLSHNLLTDTLPALNPAMTVVNLSHNQLSGSLLPVAACSRCTHVDLSYNLLSGAIPPLLASSSSPLGHLNLRSNLLSGSLPRSLAQAPMLTHLDLSRNKLKGSLPAFCQGKQRLASLLLSSNAFSGPLSSLLPSSSSCASSLLSLNVFSNQLSGSLPSSLSRFTALHSLQTARNRMSGSIPAGLTLLTALQELDASWSGLSGTIPALLRAAAPSLQVQLAGNALSGSVPSSLSDLPVSCFRPGNPKLCGKPLLDCKKSSTKPRKGRV
ncbi:unnamed protein product [Closterium sp. Yama58-4]|nr:unnamed protein product [Closterium sp. Yama58-4]